MTNILIPSRGPDDWKGFLAQPDLHWRTGFSARLWTGVQKEPRSGVIGVQSGPLILMV
jgi:hypothetical protein